MTDTYLPISDYAVIGDCNTAALVSCKGSIDWYCPGRFDSPAVFCRILDANKGGFLETVPKGDYSVSRKYLGDTNILQSVLSMAGAEIRITQFMAALHRRPVHIGDDVKTPFRILWKVEGVTGRPELRIRFRPTFDYARADARFDEILDGITASWSSRRLTLFSKGVRFRVGDDGVAEGDLKLSPGHTTWIILDYTEDESALRKSFSHEESEELLKKTTQFWTGWADLCSYRGPYRAEVLRSALTLKLLTYEPTGAIIAAPTTSLPEHIGGIRNWDYRFSWLRDSSLILYALMTVGYHQEATDFAKWLGITQEKDPTSIPQIMYKISGEGHIEETLLDHLEGYRKSKPVRIGNAAASQFQLDIFGELLTAFYLYFMMARDKDSQSDFKARLTGCRSIWPMLKDLVEDAAKKHDQPDNGIWEVRGAPRQFLYSRLMCWAALDRGIRLAETFHLDASLNDWKITRSEIRDSILKNGYNDEVKAFTQSYGSKALDAGALIIPRIGFLPPTDPRVVSTIEQIQKHLSHNGFIYRYLTEDGLPGQEATFTLCTFWQVDALALSGRQDEAQDLFEKTIGHANDVGLMSEELCSKNGEFLGNFPQGFTHLALIGSAVNLAKAAKHGSEQHPENEAQRGGSAKVAANEGRTHRLRRNA